MKNRDEKGNDSSIFEFREGEDGFKEVEVDKDAGNKLFTMMDNEQIGISINEEYKRDNRFLTSKETDRTNKIRCHSYTSNKINEGSIESFENNISERLSSNAYNFNEYSHNNSQGFSKRSNNSLQREDEKLHYRVQPTSSNLQFINNNDKKKSYNSEFNCTQDQSYKNQSNKQMYSRLNQDLIDRRNSFTGNDTTPISHFKLYELQPEVVNIVPERLCEGNKRSSLKQVPNKENLNIYANQSS